MALCTGSWDSTLKVWILGSTYMFSCSYSLSGLGIITPRHSILPRRYTRTHPIRLRLNLSSQSDLIYSPIALTNTRLPFTLVPHPFTVGDILVSKQRRPLFSKLSSSVPYFCFVSYFNFVLFLSCSGKYIICNGCHLFNSMYELRNCCETWPTRGVDCTATDTLEAGGPFPASQFTSPNSVDIRPP